MMKAAVVSAVSVMLAVSAQAGILRLASGGKSYVRIQTMSADAAVTHAASWKVKGRIDKDYELLKMYLLSFGYEIYDFKQRQNAKNPPQFSVKGRGAPVEQDD